MMKDNSKDEQLPKEVYDYNIRNDRGNSTKRVVLEKRDSVFRDDED